MKIDIRCAKPTRILCFKLLPSLFYPPVVFAIQDYPPKKYSDILAGRLKLPVYQFKEKLLESVSKNQIVVVEGETGSGAFN